LAALNDYDAQMDGGTAAHGQLDECIQPARRQPKGKTINTASKNRLKVSKVRTDPFTNDHLKISI
jgi:hypothetical protein